MEQMFLIEIFIDKIAVYMTEQEEIKKSGERNALITKVRFGPNAQFLFKEAQLAKNKLVPDEFVERDEAGRRKWIRTVKVGQSLLFPSYADTVFAIMTNWPLEFELWNDDKTDEENIFIGVGYMQWETQFLMKLKESSEACKSVEPLSIKQRTVLKQECCCKPAAEIDFILRLSPLGDSIITDFQQPLQDPDTFIFKTNKAPSSFSCKRVEVDDPKYVTNCSLYLTSITDDPTLLGTVQKKVEVCTELESCGLNTKGADYLCDVHRGQKQKAKEYPVDKVEMGEIAGPCGNTFCPLAHKIRNYIRNMDCYKENAQGVQGKAKKTRKICGACDCKEDRFHREDTITRNPGENVPCTGCMGTMRPGFSCKEMEHNLEHAATPLQAKASKDSNKSGKPDKGGKQTIAYVFSVHKVPDFKESMFGRNSVCQSLNVSYNDYLTVGALSVKSDGQCSCRAVKASTENLKQNFDFNSDHNLGISCVKTGGGCGCRVPMPIMNATQDTQVFNSVSTPNLWSPERRSSTCRMCANNQLIYSVTGLEQSNEHCLEITNDKCCKCKELDSNLKSSISCVNIGGGCGCRPMSNKNTAQETQVVNSASIPNLGSRSMIYNVTEAKQSTKYCLEITDDKDCKCRELNCNLDSGISCVKAGGGCCCRRKPNMNTAPANMPHPRHTEYKSSTLSMCKNNQLIYNVSEVKNKYCLESTDNKDCKCSPKKPSPPCGAFDCDCLQKTLNMVSRKTHRSFCPQFKHKNACYINTSLVTAEVLMTHKHKHEEEDEEEEPLPYGLPPIKLGPCPVIGRPCTVPDGFARMYKTAALPPVALSQGKAGRVCCSKEYERIKTALREFIIGDKDHDFRCVNTYNIDTERRCCDKEQVLLALMGKTCCGTHKLAIQDQFK